jgi:hypothetical protein
MVSYLLSHCGRIYLTVVTIVEREVKILKPLALGALKAVLTVGFTLAHLFFAGRKPNPLKGRALTLFTEGNRKCQRKRTRHL